MLHETFSMIFKHRACSSTFHNSCVVVLLPNTEFLIKVDTNKNFLCYNFSLTAKNKTKSSILQRKGSQDLPASEYYAIYKKHSLNSSFSDETTSVKSVNSVKDTNEQDLLQDFDSYDDAMDTKVPTAEVKVHGGGIAER